MALPDTIRVSYDISYTPNPINVTAGVSADGTKIKLKVADISDLSIDLKPNDADGITTEIQSGLLWPLAKIMSGVIANAIEDAVKGQEVDVYQVNDIPVNAGGVSIVLSPKQIDFGAHNGYLMISGKLDIKA